MGVPGSAAPPNTGAATVMEHIRAETALATDDEYGSYTFRILAEAGRTTLPALPVGELLGEEA